MRIVEPSRIQWGRNKYWNLYIVSPHFLVPLWSFDPDEEPSEDEVPLPLNWFWFDPR